MDLVTFLTIIGSFIGIMSTMITLFLYLGNKIDGISRDISTDMRDFHGRLCDIEASKVKKREK